MRRVVVTGIGVYSCIGKNSTEVRDALYAGGSGIGLDSERTQYGYRSPLTGIVPRPELKGILDRKQRAFLPQEAEFAYVSTAEALACAGLDAGWFEQHEAGILFGNDSTAQAVVEAHELIKEKRDTALVGAASVFHSMASAVSMNLATIFKLRGINFSVSGACASGSHAIGLGYLFIKQGLQDVIICGGAQEVNKYAMGSFDAIGAFSVRTGDPAKASRPFDADRDGLVPSGGAATLILEEYEHAKKRGAKVLCELGGYGFSSNGEHISQPSAKGSYAAMDRAIRDAGLQPKDIGYLNAHATSTPLGDKFEAMAIAELFGPHSVPVSSTKSMTGHECWMAGASELVYTIIMMQHDFIAPNINFERPDEHSALLRIAERRLDRRFDVAISNSFGFGGTNSALIIKRIKD
ncbi:MAG: beta-ketoacyl-[acyl-carrier-protein] synthase family protein [Bacteroidetes bacterium]|nr:beta-ketoacyl-[acyl-carrier-protein] synthase family protein [Bacteroidota bacterium]